MALDSGRKERESMVGTKESRSEVARLLSQISAEYEAAKRGLTGLSYGTSQHEFITAKQERIADMFEQIRKDHGDEMVMQIMQAMAYQEGTQAAK